MFEEAQLLSHKLLSHSFNAQFEEVYSVSAINTAAAAQGKNKRYIISENESLDPNLFQPAAATFRELLQP